MDIESVWHDKYAHRAGEGEKSSKEGIGYKSYLGMLHFYKEHGKIWRIARWMCRRLQYV